MYKLNVNNRKIETEIVSKKISELNNIFDKVILLGFDYTLKYVGFNNADRTITINDNVLSEKIIKYDDIVRVELIINGRTSMSMSNVIGGAILAGETGAIIGAMNKKEITTSKFIKFSLNDFNNPSYEIDLLNTGKTLGVDINLNSEIEKLMDTIKFIINNKQTI
mgnify:CR=1 FL=1